MAATPCRYAAHRVLGHKKSWVCISAQLLREGADTFALEADGAASLTAADVITDYSSEDVLHFSTTTSGKRLWFERNVDASTGDAGENDTVIYADKDGAADKTDIIVILADYDADITAADFETASYVGDIKEII